MKLRLVIAILCLLMGGLAGSAATRYAARSHQHTRAVMALAQIHLDRLEAAARAGQCMRLEEERGRLGFVHEELIQAFPLAYGQDADFHTRTDALGSAVRDARTEATDCAAAVARVKPIREACEACHRLYR